MEATVSRAHYDAFKADARALSEDFKRKTSCLTPLLDYLKANLDNPGTITFDQAKGRIPHKELNRFTKYAPAVHRLVSVWGTTKTYPTLELIRRYAEAYPKARFWHGVKVGNPVAIYGQGLKINMSASMIGAKDPGVRGPLPGGGPIFLAFQIDIAEAYGGAGIFRVFLPLARGRAGTDPALKFTPNDPRLWLDRDNPSAVLTMADIPSDNLLLGTHRDQIFLHPDSTRSRTIVSCIASFDTSLPQDAASCTNLHRFAVELDKIKDVLEEDTFKDVVWLLG
jgi:hypothetical protein